MTMTAARFTVLGAGGFIGSRLVTALRENGFECLAASRREPVPPAQPLGHVICCVGVTADFRSRPFDTARAHVCHVADILEKADFESFLYLSSTRVYARAADTREESSVTVNPLTAGDYYNLTKLTGEALCFSSGRQNVRVARLSNVYGDDLQSSNFLPSIIRDAIARRHVTVQNSLASSKDYVALRDVLAILPKIAVAGRDRLYNVAAGLNVTNAEILGELARITRCSFEQSPDAPTVLFPSIDISRSIAEFGFAPGRLLGHLPQLVRQFEKAAQ